MVSSWDINSPKPRRLPIGARLNGGRTVLLAAFLAVLLAAGSLVACSGEPQSLASYIAAISARRALVLLPQSRRPPCIADNVAAMTKMMIDMGIRPSGDVDADFVAMMVPHHQGAIEMARAELHYGHNEQLKRMAQEIIVTQLQEIAAMHLVLSQPSPAEQGDRTVAGDASAQGGDFK